METYVEKSILGGANIVQLREKNSSEAEIIDLGRKILLITRKYGVPLIINDSPKLAKEIGADGVHLGGNDTSIKNARALLGSKAIIGLSCYGEIERGLMAENEGADYAVFGTPYYTPTKPEREPTPLDIVREAKAKITRIPIFAIGGITPENAEAVLNTGVDGIAAITSVFGQRDPESAARSLVDIINARLG